MPITLDALRVTENNAVRVYLHDVFHRRIDDCDLLRSRPELGPLYQLLGGCPVVTKRVVCSVSGIDTLGLAEIGDEVLDVQLDGMTEVETHRVNDDVREDAGLL